MNKKKEIKIDKIKLQIGEQKLELTVSELKELQYVINELLKEEKQFITIPPIQQPPSYPPYQQWWGGGTEIYCSSNIKVEVG